MLNIEKTLWIGVELCIANSEIAQCLQRMLPKHIIALEIDSTTAGLISPLETTADSPLDFFNY